MMGQMTTMISAPLLVNMNGGAGSTTGWTTTAGTPTVLSGYNRPPGLAYSFWGGTSAQSTMFQRIFVEDFPHLISIADIDTGAVTFTTDWWGGTFDQSPKDQPRLTINFLNIDFGVLSTNSSGYKNPTTLYINQLWDLYTDTYTVPAGTRWVEVIQDFFRQAGTNNDACLSINGLTFSTV